VSYKLIRPRKKIHVSANLTVEKIIGYVAKCIYLSFYKGYIETVVLILTVLV